MELWQPCPLSLEHFADHVTDFFESERRRCEWIEGDGVYEQFRVTGESRLCGESLDIHVRHIERGALRWQVADDRRLDTETIYKTRHLHAAPIRQVGDVAVITNIAVQAEGDACLVRFQDMGGVFGASRLQRRGFDGKGVCRREFFGQDDAVIVVGARFTAERRFVAIEIQGFPVLSEIR